MKYKTTPACVALSGFLAIGAAFAADQTLQIGDHPPPIDVIKWAKGTPIQSFEPGRVYVVEFWATWCGPCQASMPHLSELARRYGDRVSIIGVDVNDHGKAKGTAYVDRILQFVARKGKAMDYDVAIDGPDNEMAKTWLEASKANGLPTAFVIDRNGVIVWFGNPLFNLESILEKVVDDKFDASAGRAMQAREKDVTRQAQGIYVDCLNLLRAKRYDEAKARLDELERVAPGFNVLNGSVRYWILAGTDRAAAHEFLESYSKDNWSNDEALSQVARVILDLPADAKPDYPMAVNVLERVVALAPSAANMAALAKACFDDGRPGEAAETQQKAVDLAAKTADFYPPFLKEMRSDLQKYQAALAETH